MAAALRALAMDAVEVANSGHPGMPLGMADVATVLFTQFLKHDPARPEWPDRDRFVLSAGHGSMLLYGLLHLCGYAGITRTEIQNFRRLHSLTPGHPEYGHTPGVETTTGPLGQGLANAVGMALAERVLAAEFGAGLVDHRTYALVSDGCLMEGVGYEAASFAGRQQLARLTLLWDDNRITIDGPTSLAFSEDVSARFAAFGWHSQAIDGHDANAIYDALRRAGEDPRPSLIACRTTIAFGADKKAGSAASHGAPLGAEEVAAVRRSIQWPHPAFEIPETVLGLWRDTAAQGSRARDAWQTRLQTDPQADDFQRRLGQEIHAEAHRALSQLANSFIKARAKEQKEGRKEKPPATRQVSGQVIATLLESMPELIGGSADLTGSNLTRAKGQQQVAPETQYKGRYIFFGVREHAMAAAMNGIALHGGLRVYGGTFLVFTDYARPAIRLAALMGLPVIFVMTHDSIGLGEDGPTHQPVEHLAGLRAIPNLLVLRPCDAVETVEAWQVALGHKGGPSLLALSRQGLETLRHSAEVNRVGEGGYVLREASDGIDMRQVTLIATGSEVALALGAALELESKGVATAVVSMPSFELFRERTEEQQDGVLGPGTIRVTIEAATGFGWAQFAQGATSFASISLDRFGASGKGSELFAHFGFTRDNIIHTVESLLAKARHT